MSGCTLLIPHKNNSPKLMLNIKICQLCNIPKINDDNNYIYRHLSRSRRSKRPFQKLKTIVQIAGTSGCDCFVQLNKRKARELPRCKCQLSYRGLFLFDQGCQRALSASVTCKINRNFRESRTYMALQPLSFFLLLRPCNGLHIVLVVIISSFLIHLVSRCFGSHKRLYIERPSYRYFSKLKKNSFFPQVRL